MKLHGWIGAVAVAATAIAQVSIVEGAGRETTGRSAFSVQKPGPGAGRGLVKRAAEANLVRDVYARLMRYEMAGRDLRAEEEGRVTGAAEYISFAIDAFQVHAGKQMPRLPSASIGEKLALERQTRCYERDPCFVYYDATWSADVPAVDPTLVPHADAWATYRVVLNQGDRQVVYDAEAGFGYRPDGAIAIVIFDPVVPGIQGAVSERMAAPQPRWRDYVRSRRYRAIVERAKSGKQFGALTAPAGYLIGDEITQQDEASVMMAGGELCTEFCSGKSDGTQCPDEGDPACSVDTCKGGTCNHKNVPPLTAYSGPDPMLDYDGMTTETKTAYQCLLGRVQGASGSMTGTSYKRTAEYQAHLYEVYWKYNQLKNYSDGM